MRFSHLLFQEYFLARHLLEQPQDAEGLEIPKETREFMFELNRE